MKKIFSFILIAVLMLGLSTTSLAADDTTDIILEVAEDSSTTVPFTGTLTGSDFWLETRYGHILLNSDGSFRYKANKDNAALNAAIDGGWSVVDRFTLTFPVWDGVWEGREISIAICPDGTKALGYWTNYTVTDLDETLEGTVLMKGESTTELLLRVPLGRLKVSADGEYSYTHFAFLETVQAMRQGWVREDRLGILSNGSGEKFDLVIHTTGDSDTPSVKSKTYNLEDSDGVIFGNALDGSTQGDGILSQHKFKWEHTTAKYGTLSFDTDGSYYYAPYPNDTAQTLTDIFVFSYTDVDGEKATGKIIINLLPMSN